MGRLALEALKDTNQHVVQTLGVHNYPDPLPETTIGLNKYINSEEYQKLRKEYEARIEREEFTKKSIKPEDTNGKRKYKRKHRKPRN